MKNSLEALAEVVAASVLVDAIETSRNLARIGVPHALIGGLAVGLHGHPRATKDVDFLVGDEAFSATHPVLMYREELSEIVRIGQIDLMSVPPGHEELRAVLQLPERDEIPVIPIPCLVYLKLAAGRPQDMADVHSLLQRGVDLREINEYLNRFAPEQVSRFAEIAAEVRST